MVLDVQSAIRYTWEALALVWLVGLAFTKRTVKAGWPGARLFYMALALLGFALLASSYLSAGWLGNRLYPQSDGAEIAGLVLTVAGCLFAIWARITLGSNWSGRPTVKQDHELITRGPYALARHPIYTGILMAGLGTGVAIGEARCALGYFILVIALMIKMSQEERLMMQTFPHAYPAYRGRVKALIPGVF